MATKPAQWNLSRTALAQTIRSERVVDRTQVTSPLARAPLPTRMLPGRRLLLLHRRLAQEFRRLLEPGGAERDRAAPDSRLPLPPRASSAQRALPIQRQRMSVATRRSWLDRAIFGTSQPVRARPRLVARREVDRLLERTRRKPGTSTPALQPAATSAPNPRTRERGRLGARLAPRGNVMWSESRVNRRVVVVASPPEARTRSRPEGRLLLVSQGLWCLGPIAALPAGTDPFR